MMKHYANKFVRLRAYGSVAVACCDDGHPTRRAAAECQNLGTDQLFVVRSGQPLPAVFLIRPNHMPELMVSKATLIKEGLLKPGTGTVHNPGMDVHFELLRREGQTAYAVGCGHRHLDVESAGRCPGHAARRFFVPEEMKLPAVFRVFQQGKSGAVTATETAMPNAEWETLVAVQAVVGVPDLKAGKARVSTRSGKPKRIQRLISI